MPILSSRSRSRLSPRRIRSRRRESGTTVLEVMIAAFILGIIALQLTAFFAKGRVLFDHEERKRVAVQLGQEALEEALGSAYDDVLPWTDTATIANLDYDTDVTVTVNAPEPGMKTVRAEVTWQATASSTRSVTLITYVYDN